MGKQGGRVKSYQSAHRQSTVPHEGRGAFVCATCLGVSPCLEELHELIEGLRPMSSSRHTSHATPRRHEAETQFDP